MAEFGCLCSEVLLARNAWEKRKLGSLIEKRGQKNENLDFSSSAVLSAASIKPNPPVKKSSDQYMKTYNIFLKGDLVFEGHTSKQYLFGRFVFNDFRNGIVSHVFDVYRFKVLVDNDFAKRFFHSEHIMQKPLLNSVSNARMLNSLNSRELYKQEIRMPGLSEQKQIGKILKQVDNLIAATQDKIDALEQAKKALLQHLFDQSWRFKGYSDPWEKRKLGEVITLTGGGTPSKKVHKYWHGSINWLSSQEIKGRFVHKGTYQITEEAIKNSATKLIEKNTPLFVYRSGILAHRFPIALTTQRVAINQDIKAMIFDHNRIVPQFLVSELQSQESFILHNIVKTGTTVQSVAVADFLKMPFLFPQYDEQNRVAIFLDFVETLIAATQSILSSLELLKKALLQDLFI